jgi:hypothetical protein
MIKKCFLTVVLLSSFFTGQVFAEPIAYSIDGEDPANLYRIDLATGTASLIGSVGISGDFEALCFNNNGILFAVEDEDDRLYRINTATGAATIVGNLGVDIEGAGCSFDSSGTLWLATWGEQTLFTVNPTTGAATQIGSFGGLGEYIDGTAWDGINLYGIGSEYGTSTTDYLYTIDRTLGTASQVGPLVNITLEDNAGLTEDSSGTLWGIDEITGQIFTINKITGEATVVSTTIANEFESLAIGQSAQVSVPTMTQWGSIILMILAGLGAVYHLRRQKRANN